MTTRVELLYLSGEEAETQGENLVQNGNFGFLPLCVYSWTELKSTEKHDGPLTEFYPFLDGYSSTASPVLRNKNKNS